MLVTRRTFTDVSRSTLCVLAIAWPGYGYSQSVLERVLGQIDGATNLAQVNGTFANIAENLGQPAVPASSVTEQDILSVNDRVLLGFIHLDSASSVIIDGVTYLDKDPIFATADGTGINPFDGSKTVTLVPDTSSSAPFVGIISNLASFADLELVAAGAVGTAGTPQTVTIASIPAFSKALGSPLYAGTGFVSILTAVNGVTLPLAYNTIVTPGTSGSGIDGSITNIVTGVTSATQEAVAGAVTATEFTLPTFDLGDMATTALGAVNTGEITLGVNSAVDEASTSTTNAISAVMTQIGGSADTGALVLNVASNASAVQGSIQNTMASVNGSIGNLSTTALGAVNTGTITSGVNAAVQGIVGMPGQSGL